MIHVEGEREASRLKRGLELGTIHPEERDSNGLTIVQRAAKYGLSEFLEYFLSKYPGTDLNDVSSIEKQTALMFAAEEGYDEIIRFLLSRGANLNFSNENISATALHLSINHYSAVCTLVECGANLTSKSANGMNILILASVLGKCEVVKYLLGKEILSIDDQDSLGSTALIHAVRESHYDIVELLLENGANVDIQSIVEGYTAVHHAITNGDFEITSLLLKHNPDLRLQDNIDGYTPLMMAMECSQSEIALLLMTHDEICFEGISSEGKSALEIAIDNDESEIITIIKNTLMERNQLFKRDIGGQI